MRIHLFTLTALFLLTACATNAPDSGDPLLQERIKSARKSVKIIKPDSPDWCTATASCKYIGDFYCGAEKGSREKGEKKCMKKIKNNSVKVGGDTFVIQDRGLVPGQNELFDRTVSYRVYGQAYNCTNKNESLGKEYIAAKDTPRMTDLQIVTKKYHDRCNTNKPCTPVKPHNCSTVQDKSFKRCIMQLEKIKSRGKKPFNYVIINRDLFNKIGAYRLFTETLMCQ